MKKLVGAHFIKSHFSTLSKLITLSFEGNLKELQEKSKENPKQLLEKDYDKRTCLHLACEASNYEIAEFLLQNGANPNSKDRWGCSPFQITVQQSNNKMSRLLKEYGANFEEVRDEKVTHRTELIPNIKKLFKSIKFEDDHDFNI